MTRYRHPVTKAFISKAKAAELGLLDSGTAKGGEAGSRKVVVRRARGRIIRREVTVARSD